MLKIGKPRTIEGLARFCAKIANEKKAENILILDLTKTSVAPAEFFVICSCETTNHMQSLAYAILDKCNELKLEKPRIEGNEYSSWFLLDFFYVIVHIMVKGAREYYQLEKLWSDSKFIKYENGKFHTIKFLK